MPPISTRPSRYRPHNRYPDRRDVRASGSIFTTQSLSTWYGTLQRPVIAPPNWVFCPVWTVLFVLNVGWSAVFFGLQELGWGLAVIGLLWLLIVTTMWAFDRIDRRAALLFVPYLLWVSFAAYLNYRFWVLN